MTILRYYKVWTAVVILLLLIGVISYVTHRPHSIVVIHPDRQIVAQLLTASGQVQGVQTSQLAPETPGVLAELLVKEGETVQRGMVVARVVATSAQARVMEAEASLTAVIAQRDELRQELARHPLSLSQTRADAEATIAETRMRVKRAEARLAELRQGGTTEERLQAEAAVKQATLQVTLAHQQQQRAEKLATADATASAEVQTAAARVTEAAARVQSARESLSDAEHDYARYDALFASGAASRTQRDKAVTARETARSTLAQYEAQREQANIALQRQQELLTINRRADADDAAARLAIAEKALEAALSHAREVTQPAREEELVQQTAELDAARTSLKASNASVNAHIAFQQAEPVTERLARAEAQVRAAREVLAGNRAQLAQLAIIAPFDGQVVNLLSRPGTVVGPSQPVLTFSQMRGAEVQVNVDEREIVHVQLGQRVIVITDAYPTSELPGRVLRIGSQVDIQSGVIPVIVHLLSPPFWLRSGMTADASFLLEAPREHLVLPPSAIMRDGEKSTLFLVLHGQVTVRSVQAGNSSPKGVVILSGVADDAMVVLDPTKVVPGQPVQPELAAKKGRQ